MAFANNIEPDQLSDQTANSSAHELMAHSKTNRRAFVSLLLAGTAVIFIGIGIGIGIAIGITVRQKMNNSSNNPTISCSPTCPNNGTCVANNVCRCASGYNGTYCQTPICNPLCLNGNCTAPNVCTCLSGYNGTICANPICSSNCVNGTCLAPNSCKCQSGWSDNTCSTPTCTPACVNGICSNPNTCTCNSGWNGSICNSPICTSPCLNGGTCTAPNRCTCTSQYKGSTCANLICTSPCQNNGNCTAPNTCTCPAGYTGSTCQNQICSPACLNGGTCVLPNTCVCIPDVWTGSYCQTPIRILWTFDNSLSDFYGNYQGVGINGPSYSSPGINGYGSCLYLDSGLKQSVTISSPPFLNMAQTSFSLLAWVNAASLNNGNMPYSDSAIFGQFDSNTQDRSLHIIVRNRKIYLGFYYDDLAGNTVLNPGSWYHMAYIYDYSTLTQYVYVNGVLDVSGSPKGPYKGTSGNLTIGTNGVFAGTNYWNGCIDQVSYFARAKNATEVLRDATLTVEFTFDNVLVDNGPLGINGTGTNYSYASAGRISRSLALFNNQSYVQATGLLLLGTNAQSYSLSIWIKPKVTTRGSIVHVSGLTSGLGWCIPMIGFTSAGIIVAQSWNFAPVIVTGPSATANVWTHVAVTYSLSVGLRLWINGIQYGSASGAFSYCAAGSPVTVTLGSSLNGTGLCFPGEINMGQYYGYLDQFGLYSRELSTSDVLALANP